MREIIDPNNYKGVYYDKVCCEDLIIMGDKPDKIKALMPLKEGINESLWRLSLETGLGIVIDIRRIPLKQGFIDLCNKADTNPYEQPMDREIYIVHPRSEYHLKKDISVIGYMIRDTVCRVINGDRESYLKS